MIAVMSKQIDALLSERAGYEMRGLKDRVAAVDEQLHLLGFSHKYISPPEKSVVVETAETSVEVETAVVKRGRKPKADNGDS
jgi:hypothetical protein